MYRIVVPALALLLAVQMPVHGQQSLNVAFITRNAYGNNLYLDNVTAGRRLGHDVAVLGFGNIAADTSYLPGGSSLSVAPVITVVNLGLLPVTTPFTITCTSLPAGYTSTRTISSLARGAATQVVMDTLLIPASTAQVLSVVASMADDEQRSNDTLRQTSLFFPGVPRIVLLEEWTSSTCGPCAANNPTIDAFIAAKGESLAAVKYHVGWPSPGDDPMYLFNPTQSYDRRNYYGVNTVPHVIMDGVVTPTYPYTTSSSLPGAFTLRRPLGTPVGLAVRDSALSGDSVEARVTLTILSPLRAGSYKLRVQTIERRILYPQAPGTNGEAEFLEVFRGAYPSSAGTVIPTTPGTHVFSFRYSLPSPVIRDSLSTLVFVQNDVTREVMNAARAQNHALMVRAVAGRVERVGARDRCTAGDLTPGTKGVPGVQQVFPTGGFSAELLEGPFPPPGWRLANPDRGITLEGYTGVNGPSFGGGRSSKMDFYAYSTNGQTDTLFSSTFTGLLPTDSLTFDWAYAQYPGYSDRLIVKASTNGGITYDSTIFDLSGAALATAPSTTNEFIPLGSQWRTYRYPLSGLIRAVPAAPSLLLPPDGATGTTITPTLVWNRVAGALRYCLQVSLQSSFTTLLVNDSTLTDSSRVLSPMAAGTLHYWRVRAVGAGGSGPWSAFRQFTTATLLSRSYTVRASWNLLAVPLTVADPRRTVLFPSASSEAYGFDPASGYVRADTLLNGAGYWLKFPSAGSVLLTGYERPADTVALHQGWNLIGSVSAPVAVNALAAIPDSILASAFYGYGGGYAPADTIHPAAGYWIKASAPGTLILAPAARAQVRKSEAP